MIRPLITRCAALLLLGGLAACSEETQSLAALGYPCTDNAQCETATCYRDTCALAQRKANGQACFVKGECRSYTCAGGVCVQGRGQQGSYCTANAECQSDFCQWNKCQSSRLDAGVPDAGPDAADDLGPDSGTPDLGADLGPDAAPDKGPAPDQALPDKGPPPDAGQCSTSAGCDDNLACTTDTCVSGVCKYTLQTNYCLISGVCIPDGVADSKNPCLKCDAQSSTSSWASNDGSSCDDKQKCTYNDTCSAGTCKGTAYVCDDKLACTTDACTGLGPGPKGCNSTLNSGHCLIGLRCYKDNELRDPNKGCQKCDSSKMTYNWTPASGKGCITTLAGTGASGLSNGEATKASFSSPSGIAVDGSGNVYVADTGNHVIRLISRKMGQGGTYTIEVSTWAGSGSSGFADGDALKKASFSGPTDIEIDSTGKVYLADTGNHAVRVVWNNLVNTLAGAGVKGYLDGPVMGAKFSGPTGVAVDDSTAAVKVYVADPGNARIRKVDVGLGMVSTVAGTGSDGHKDGPVASAQFYAPWDIERSAAGVLYVSEAGSSTAHYIRTISGGTVSTLAGAGGSGFADGAALSAKFKTPRGLLISSSITPLVSGYPSLLVADAGNYRLRLLSYQPGSPSDGGTPGDASSSGGYRVQTFAGDGTSGLVNHQALLAKFKSPYAIAEDSKGNMYIADAQNNVIRLYTP